MIPRVRNWDEDYLPKYDFISRLQLLSSKRKSLPAAEKNMQVSLLGGQLLMSGGWDGPSKHTLAGDAEDELLRVHFDNRKNTIADAQNTRDRFWIAES